MKKRTTRQTGEQIFKTLRRYFYKINLHFKKARRMLYLIHTAIRIIMWISAFVPIPFGVVSTLVHVDNVILNLNHMLNIGTGLQNFCAYISEEFLYSGKCCLKKQANHYCANKCIRGG